MIEVSRMNGSRLMISVEQIRSVESCPDTVITYSDGKTLMVKESPTEIADRIRAWYRSLRNRGES